LGREFLIAVEEASKGVEQLTFRVERSLKSRFEDAVRKRRLKMTPVIVEMVKDYVSKAEQESGIERPPPGPDDLVDLSDLDRDQRKLLSVALVAIRQPALNEHTDTVSLILRRKAEQWSSYILSRNEQS
jgi:hypothetical protein